MVELTLDIPTLLIGQLLEEDESIGESKLENVLVGERERAAESVKLILHKNPKRNLLIMSSGPRFK